MKKLLLLFATVLLLTAFVTNAYAEGIYVYDFTIEGIEITLQSNTYLDEDDAYEIALSIVNNEGDTPEKGAWCTINGHTMQETTAITTQHKYYSTAPRCLQKTYLIRKCSVCGYTESTLISSVRIYCCS